MPGGRPVRCHEQVLHALVWYDIREVEEKPEPLFSFFARPLGGEEYPWNR
jgi:hypothetical protein